MRTASHGSLFGTLDLLWMLPSQLRRATGEIRIPEEAREGKYDLVCIGSPTWWLTTCMPIRSFMKSDAAARLLRQKRFAAILICRHETVPLLLCTC